MTGDALGSLKCDCGPQLKRALNEIQHEGVGLFSIFVKKVEELDCLQKYKPTLYKTEGYDTLDANIMLGHPPDARDYTVAAQMLQEMGIKKFVC